MKKSMVAAFIFVNGVYCSAGGRPPSSAREHPLPWCQRAVFSPGVSRLPRRDAQPGSSISNGRADSHRCRSGIGTPRPPALGVASARLGPRRADQPRSGRGRESRPRSVAGKASVSARARHVATYRRRSRGRRRAVPSGARRSLFAVERPGARRDAGRRQASAAASALMVRARAAGMGSSAGSARGQRQRRGRGGRWRERAVTPAAAARRTYSTRRADGERAPRPPTPAGPARRARPAPPPSVAPGTRLARPQRHQRRKQWVGAQRRRHGQRVSVQVGAGRGSDSRPRPGRADR